MLTEEEFKLLDVSEKEEYFRRVKASRGREDLIYFAKEILGYREIDEAVHGRLVEVLNSEDKRKLILLPRGSFKSSIATISFSIWKLLSNRNLRVLIDSQVLDNSQKFLNKVKEHMRKEYFWKLYGRLLDHDKRETAREFTIKRTDSMLKEPSVSASGIGTVNIGMHYDLIIADDLHSEKNVGTDEQIEKVIAHYRLLLSLLEPTGELIIIGTRWHWGDLYDYLLEEEIPSGSQWNVYVERAIREDGSLFFPQRLTREFLDDQRKAQGSYVFSCTPAETPILMGDFTCKPISEVKVGDEVIGWIRGDKLKNSKLVKTKVLETNSRISLVQKMIMESGRVIRCTPDHNWWTGRSDKTHKEYSPAKVGRTLKLIFNPKEIIQTGDSRWLGGIFDGEGSCSRVITLTQSKTKNPEVFNHISEVLKNLKFDFGCSHRQSGAGDGAHSFWLKGGWEERRRFLLITNPVKTKRIERSLLSSKFALDDKVVKIEPDKFEPVYALTTETGNYIAWGYASKNCQYMNEPIAEEDQTFKKSYFKYWGSSDDSWPMLDGKRILLNIYILVDRAFSTKESADYTGIVVCGVSCSGNIYVLEATRKKCGLQLMTDLIFEFVNKYGADRIRSLNIETINYEEVYPFIQDQMRKRNKYVVVNRLVPDSRMSKRGRIEAALQARFANGAIYLKKRMIDFEDELLRFPKNTHDDLIDAFAYVVQVMTVPGNPGEEREVDYEPMFSKTGY